MTQDSSIYWKGARVELRAAGFEPDRAAKTSAVVTIASRMDQRASLQQPRSDHRRFAG